MTDAVRKRHSGTGGRITRPLLKTEHKRRAGSNDPALASSVVFMRIARAGALRLPAQFQVLRTGAGEAKRPAANLRALGEERSAPRDVILVGDCVAEMTRSPRPRSISSSPILPIICNSKARCPAPTRAWSTRSTTTGTSSPISPNMTPSRAPGWPPSGG